VTACFCPLRFGGTRAFLVLALGSLTPALFAQQQRLDREIGFVRALAREMRFIELAKEEADRLATEFRGAADQDKIAQLAVEVSYYGARSRSDRSQQRVLFKEAIDKSKELIDRSSDATVQVEARSTLANASQEFGQFLVEEIEIAREDSPERVKELEEEAAGVFRAGIEACTKVMDHLRPLTKDPEKQIEYYLVWMRRGVLSREQARAVKADRGVYIARAIEDLTEMVLEVGEETAIGLRGLFEIAQCHEVEGKIGDAIDLYKGTVAQIKMSLEQSDELGLTGEMQAFLFEMMQEVYLRTAEVMIREGSPDTGNLFTQFRENMAQFGEKDLDVFEVVNNQWGHLMLLAESRFLAESGDKTKVAQALAMTQKINDKHPADYVGVKAKAVLRDILEVQSSLVSGTLLFEIGKGEFQNKNYEEAIKRLRRALGAMTEAEQQKLGLETWQLLGTSFGLTDRYLEAILALTQGLQKFGTSDKDRASDTADTLDRAMSQHKRTTRNDPFFDPIYGSAANQIAEYSVTGGSKLFWKAANEAFNDKKYAEAITEYAKIQPDFLYYELGRVRAAKAQSATGDFAGTRQTLKAYREWAEANPIDSRDTGKQQVRGMAMAEAEYTEVQMLYSEARGAEEFQLQKDLTKYPAAIERARTFVANFAKDGDAYIATVLAYLGRLHTDLGELDQAEKVYAQLKQKDEVRASRLATEVFKEYQDQVASLRKEEDAAIAQGKDDATIAAATSALSQARAKLVALGLDYIGNSPKPQLAVLIGTMQAAEQLGQWKRVDEVARKTLDLYGGDADGNTQKVVDLLVRPMIGEALLRQQRFQEAYDMLIAAEKANPQQWEIKRQICRALGGWFEFSATGAPLRIAGLDKPAEAYDKYYGEYRTWGLRTPEVKKYSLEWYRFHWEAFWFAKQAGEKVGKYKEYADSLYRIAKSTDNFATLRSYGAEGMALQRNFQFNR
jgi:tetratricopeptide (TPR) repeat protein